MKKPRNWFWPAWLVAMVLAEGFAAYQYVMLQDAKADYQNARAEYRAAELAFDQSHQKWHEENGTICDDPWTPFHKELMAEEP